MLPLSVYLPAGEGATAIEVLNILPFDSFRKRMSVIIRHPATQEIIVYCKGADTNIFTCLKSYQSKWSFYYVQFSFQSRA